MAGCTRAGHGRLPQVVGVGVERQRERVSAQVVEEEQGYFAHGDREDEEPAESADEEEGRRDDAVEAEEEDDAAEIPFPTPKEPFLRADARGGVATSARVVAVVASEEAVSLVDVVVVVVSASADNAAVDVRWAEKQAAFLEIASLPALVLGDAPAFALVFLGVSLVALEFDVFAEGEPEVVREVQQHAAVFACAFDGG